MNYKIWLKCFLWVIFLLLILPTTSGCQDLKPALQAYEKGEYDQTIQLLNQYILQKPNDPEAYFYLGNVYVKKNMLDSAIVQYIKALDLKSKYWEAMYQLGYAYYKQRRYDEAQKTFEEGLKIKERGEFYNGLGLVQMTKDMLKEADFSFRKARSYDQKNPEFHKNLGDVNFRKGVVVVAIQSYQDALKLDSTLVDAHYNLAQCYLKQMDFNKAMEEFKTTIRLDPRHKDAYLALGDLYMLDRKHYPEARIIFEEYLKFDQQNSKVHLNLGEAYYHLSKIANFLVVDGDTLSKPQILSRSVENLEKSIALDPKVTDAYLLRGRAYQDLGKFPEALNDYEIYEKLLTQQNYEWKDRDADFWVRKGQVQAEMGDSAGFASAEVSLRKAIELDSTQVQAYFSLGTALYNQRRYKEAIPFFKKRIEGDPNHINSLVNLAYSYLNLNQYGEAIEPLTRLVELKPDNVAAYDLLARVYLNLNKFEEAKDQYLKEIQLEPSKCELQANVAYCYMRLNNPASAVPHYRKVVSCFPKNVDHLLSLAKALHGSKNIDEAYQYYLKVLEIDPNNKDAKDAIDYIDMQRY